MRWIRLGAGADDGRQVLAEDWKHISIASERWDKTYHDYTPCHTNAGQKRSRTNLATKNRGRWLEQCICYEEHQRNSRLTKIN